jgi:hypothetical protein
VLLAAACRSVGAFDGTRNAPPPALRADWHDSQAATNGTLSATVQLSASDVTIGQTIGLVISGTVEVPGNPFVTVWGNVSFGDGSGFAAEASPPSGGLGGPLYFAAFHAYDSAGSFTINWSLKTVNGSLAGSGAVHVSPPILGFWQTNPLAGGAILVSGILLVVVATRLWPLKVVPARRPPPGGNSVDVRR